MAKGLNLDFEISLYFLDQGNVTHTQKKQNIQHDLPPRIYVLHKITIALKFMSYINL